MDKIYVLRYADGSYYCLPSVNDERKTNKLGLAWQSTDLNAVSIRSTVQNLTITELQPVNLNS